MKKSLLKFLLIFISVIITSCGSGSSGPSQSGIAPQSETTAPTESSVQNMTVTMINHANNESYVPVSTSIVLQFSEPVASANSDNIKLYKDNVHGLTIPVTIKEGVNNTYTLKPLIPLNSNTTYYVALTNQIIDNMGNHLANTTFSFTTMQAISYIANSGTNSILLCLSGSDMSFSNCTSMSDPTFLGITSIAVNETHTTLYVTNAGNSTVSKCSISNTLNPAFPGEIAGCTITGTGFTRPAGIALDHTNTHAYITDYIVDKITVCNIDSNSNFTNCTTIGNHFLSAPSSIVISNNDSYVYVANHDLFSISGCIITENSDLKCEANGTASIHPMSIALNFLNTYAYITYPGKDVVQLCSILDNGSLSDCHNTGNGYQGGHFSSTVTGITININGSYALITDSSDSSMYHCDINKVNSMSGESGGGELSDSCSKLGNTEYLSYPSGVVLSE